MLLREFNDWRTTWTQILSGRFTNSPYSGLLFYEQADGYAETYATNGTGGIAMVATHPGWRSSWTHIVAGEFINTLDWDQPIYDDLFFYEGSTGYCETYESDGQGGISLNASESDLPAATHIVPGSFGGDGNTNLLFYDQATGIGTFRNFSGTNWVPREDFSWPRKWDLLTGGNFWMADPEDRLFAEGRSPISCSMIGPMVTARSTCTNRRIQLRSSHLPAISRRVAYCLAKRSTFMSAARSVPITITIFRQGVNEAMVGQVEGLPTAPTPLPIGITAYKFGAGWPIAGRFHGTGNLADRSLPGPG